MFSAPALGGWRPVLIWLIGFVVPLAGVLGLYFPRASAADVPIQASNDYQIETFGPAFPIAQSAWYSNPANGVGAGYHYAEINVPCGWPAAKSIGIDIFSPSMDQNGAGDEPRSNGRLDTVFELYQPGTPVGPGVATPGPGAAGSLLSRTYAPGINAAWQRFTTLAAPVPCGAYILRSEAQDDDGNVWRLHVGYDNDQDPTNRAPRDADNPDGVLGTGDELAIGVIQTGFKHPQRTLQCLDQYEYVEPGLGSVAFHNFDMESSGSVTYFSPSGARIVGKASGARVWNNGTTTDRGSGDVIPTPESGWWRINSCAGGDAHFIQEGLQNTPSYYQQPPTPRMVVSKDDGRTIVKPNETLNYTISFTNTANMAPFPLAAPGAGQRLVIRDTLPSHTTFQSCALTAPLTGSCSLNAGVVAFTLDGPAKAGSKGSVQLTLTTDADTPVGPLRNDVTLSYQDDFGHAFLASGNDIDALQSNAADLALTKTVDQPRPNVGGVVTFTIAASNSGPVDATNVMVGDVLPAGLEYVSSAADAGAYDPATGEWAIGNLPNGASARLRIAAKVVAPGGVTNTAQVTHSDQPDPDSAPNNNNPAEDDQASAAVQPQIADLSLTKRPSTSSPRSGDSLTYTIAVTNQGPDAATNVAVSDPLPAGVLFMSASASQGGYNSGTGLWAVGSLAPGASATLQIGVVVTTNEKITNTAQVSAADQFDPDSTPGNSNPAEDDQASVTTPIAPTAVSLTALTATRQADGTLVAWSTGVEINTWGFELYRSADGQRDHAVAVTSEPVPARGRGQSGASYTLVDPGVAGATYWLREIEASGATREYGPLQAAPQIAGATNRVWLPLVLR